MEFLSIILLAVSIIIANIVVNGAYKLYMKLTGADAMFFNGKKKLFAKFVVAFMILGIILQTFGIST